MQQSLNSNEMHQNCAGGFPSISSGVLRSPWPTSVISVTKPKSAQRGVGVGDSGEWMFGTGAYTTRDSTFAWPLLCGSTALVSYHVSSLARSHPLSSVLRKALFPPPAGNRQASRQGLSCKAGCGRITPSSLPSQMLATQGPISAAHPTHRRAWR